MLALLIVCIGIGSAGYAALLGERFGCAVLAVLGLLWLRVNKPVEGDVLLVLTVHHGVTTADLFSVTCFAIAAWGWNRNQRRRRRSEHSASANRYSAEL